MTVLELGSGLGGDSERLASRYGARVVAVDLSPDMIAVCRERLESRPELDIQFSVGDMRSTPLIEQTRFDVIWTRDCGAFIDLADKHAMWSRLSANSLQGTQVLITDYCLGPTPPSVEFLARMKAWGQNMIGFNEYREVLRDAGFVDVVIEDRTPDLLESMHEGQAVLESERESFLTEMSFDDYDSLKQRWTLKIQHCTRGELAWLALTARRP